MQTKSFSYALDPDGAGGSLTEALARAEQALSAHAGGQLDAVIEPGGEVYLLVGAQKQLQRNEARLKGLLASLPDALWTLDEEGDILSVNAAVTTLLGHEASSLVGRSFMAFVHPEEWGELEQAFAAVSNGVPRRNVARFRYRAEDESWRQLEASITLMDSSHAGRFLVNGREDCDQRNPADVEKIPSTEVADLTRQMAISLAVLSHELRTPLTPVLLEIELLREDPALAHLASSFDMMERNLKLQVRLIDELKDLARIGQHKTGLSLTPIDIHAAVGFVLTICAESIDSLRIAVRLDLEASDYTVQADSLKLQQIIWNVLQNAIKFSEPGGTVVISSRNPRPGEFVLEITDQGAGIAADFLPLVFEPFKQSPASTRRKSGSLGLGMYIARGMAEAHHGTLTVASDGVGHGCTFRLCLPCAPNGELPETLGSTSRTIRLMGYEDLLARSSLQMSP